MQRSKFPYTARSSARVIRHAVSIDERRAKFRSDLISGAKTPKTPEREEHHRETHGQKTGARENLMSNGSNASQLGAGRFRRRSQFSSTVELNKAMSPRLSAVEEGYLDPRGSSHGRLPSTGPAISRNAASDGVSIITSTSIDSYQPGQHPVLKSKIRKARIWMEVCLGVFPILSRSLSRKTYQRSKISFCSPDLCH